MKKVILLMGVMALYFCIIDESKAEIKCNCGSSENDGKISDCCWEIISLQDENNNEKKILKIFANEGKTDVAIKGYGYYHLDGNNSNYWSNLQSTAPWAGKGVTEIIIGDGITKVGEYTFTGETSVRTVTMKDVNSVGYYAFRIMPELTFVDMPNVTEIASQAFEGDINLSYVVLPKNFTTNEGSFNSSGIPNCGKKGGSCGICDRYIMGGIGCVDDCGDGYLEKNGRCISSTLGCGENYKDMGGWCNRIRYTPAEAAKVLKNDNTNEIVITFKK